MTSSERSKMWISRPENREKTNERRRQKRNKASGDESYLRELEAQKKKRVRKPYPLKEDAKKSSIAARRHRRNRAIRNLFSILIPIVEAKHPGELYQKPQLTKTAQTPAERSAKYYKKRREERAQLFSLMTPTQRNKFLARERKIKAEKKRAAVLAKALKEQADRLKDLQSGIQDKRDQKQELEIRAHEMQREKLMIEAEKLNKIKVDRAVAKIISHRDSRAYRYRSSAKTYMQRVRAAIDDYYQSIANDNPLRKAA